MTPVDWKASLEDIQLDKYGAHIGRIRATDQIIVHPLNSYPETYQPKFESNAK